MHVQFIVFILWLLPLVATQEVHLPPIAGPRRWLPYSGQNIRMFHSKQSLFFNLLVSDKLQSLMVSASDCLFALSLRDVSRRDATKCWPLSHQSKTSCLKKHSEIYCRNHIRVLHEISPGRYLICGTNGGFPKCRIMRYSKKGIQLFPEYDANERAPLDPLVPTASTLSQNHLFIGTYLKENFSDPVYLSIQSTSSYARTLPNDLMFKDPVFVSAIHVPESRFGETGEQDKAFLFFSETEVGVDFQTKKTISRVAFVCADDQGWGNASGSNFVSFLKAKIDCPVVENELPFLIQDSYLLCDLDLEWSECTIYATFTAQSETNDFSAVCVYLVSGINRVFSKADFMTILPERGFPVLQKAKLPVPFPRPGECITDRLLKMHITGSREIPNATVHFAHNHPIMDQVVKPLWSTPMLLRRGAFFTRIVVVRIRTGSGTHYRVMFIGTAEGTLVKAVHLDKEMFIIEEQQILSPPEEIKAIRYFNKMIYTISSSGVSQVSAANCEKYPTCSDCVLARDPFCGWKEDTRKCVLATRQEALIQNVESRDFTGCKPTGPLSKSMKNIVETTYLELTCEPFSNLAKVEWEKDGVRVKPSSKLQLVGNTLIIPEILYPDRGSYHCISEEETSHGPARYTIHEYKVKIERVKLCGITFENCSAIVKEQTTKLQLESVLIYVTLSLFAIIVFVLLTNAFYKSFKKKPKRSRSPTPDKTESSSSKSLSESATLDLDNSTSVKLDDVSVSPVSPTESSLTEQTPK